MRRRRRVPVPANAASRNGGAADIVPTTRSLIFEIPIDLARPVELLRRITGWVGESGAPRRVMYVNAHVLNQ